MSIPQAYSNRFVYHFTHLDNLPQILSTGFLCNNHPKFPTKCKSIAEPGIQDRRAAMAVPCGPRGVVHDYVPLYFGSLSPMLLGVINKKNIDQFEIIYFEFPINLLTRDDVIFTDASANTLVPPTFYTNPTDLANLNWAEIDSRKWKSQSEDLRHQRMAEVLVHRQLDVEKASRVVVWNDEIRKYVLDVAKSSGVNFPAVTFEAFERPHFFVNFFEKGGKRSVVTGPKGIALQYDTAVEELSKSVPADRNGAFPSLKALLSRLRANFGAIPQTEELVGLRSENGIHRRTVDAHTLEVVENLRDLAGFEALSPSDRDIVELAAYLHDIGKGPKERWDDNGGLQKVDPDHPVRAMPMLVEILTLHVQKWDLTTAKTLVKLVCYHDLVGEVLGKGRDEQQIVDAFDNPNELDMAFALGKADATSLVEEWWNEEKAAVLYERCRDAIVKKAKKQGR